MIKSSDVGVPGVVQLAKAMGVDRSKLDPVPSLALGTSPVTLLEMVSGYSTIADRGQYRKPIYIKRIVDRHGKVLAEFGTTETRRAMSERSAVELLDIMRGVITQGTGTAMKTRFGIVADLGGKTGTTQRNTDGWFIAMHPGLVAGAWVGFNDTRVTHAQRYWGQGGHNASFNRRRFPENHAGQGGCSSTHRAVSAPAEALIVAERRLSPPSATGVRRKRYPPSCAWCATRVLAVAPPGALGRGSQPLMKAWDASRTPVAGRAAPAFDPPDRRPPSAAAACRRRRLRLQ